MKVISITEHGKKKLVDISSSQANVVLENVTCSSDVFVGAVVIMRNNVAYNALADSVDNSNVMGVVESKSDTTICNIRVSGVTGDIYTGLNESYEYYLSEVTAGAITTAIPTSSGSVIIRIGQPFSESRLFINKGERIIRS